MNRIFLLLGILGLTCEIARAAMPDESLEVFVVYNKSAPGSKEVAEHYIQMRHVPADHVLGVTAPDVELVNRTDFRETLQKPILAALLDRGFWKMERQTIPATNSIPKHTARRVTKSSIKYLVLCYGIPLLIGSDTHLHEPGEETLPEPYRKNGAAVDSELSCLPVIDDLMLSGPRPNPAYGCTNIGRLDPTNGVLMVTRLDGPSEKIANALVDKAMQADMTGLWGRAYFDARGLPTNDTYYLGDQWILGAAEICRRVGFETYIDTNYGTLHADFPLSQVALYAGWYDESASGPFARPTVEFMPGAFAYHLQSFSAASLRTTTRQWVGPLLDRGVTCTMGCVDEPFLNGTPNIQVFFARFITAGFDFGEAAYACQAMVSWQTTVVGDPLYRPFGRNPLKLQDEMVKEHSKLLEWYYLRLVNYDLIGGLPLNNVVTALENENTTTNSAVLEEKLAELYLRQGKPSSSVYALQAALKLDPTPQQRIRIMLALGEQLQTLGRNAEAYEIYRDFSARFPDYANLLEIYKNLQFVAEKLGKADDAVKYQHVVDALQSKK